MIPGLDKLDPAKYHPSRPETYISASPESNPTMNTTTHSASAASPFTTSAGFPVQPIPVSLIGHGLSIEAVTAIVCGVAGTMIPLGIVLTKHAVKRCRGQFPPPHPCCDNLLTLLSAKLVAVVSKSEGQGDWGRYGARA